MVLDQVRDVTRKGRLYAHVLRKTGVLREIRLAGAWTALRTLVRGTSGPSAIFRIQHKNHPDRDAFVFEGRAWTYRDVDERVDRIAAGLRAHGLRRGDSALVMLKNRPESLEIGAALSRIGAGGVSVSWRSTPAELHYLAANSGAQAIFFEAELLGTVEAARANLPALRSDRLFPVGAEVPGLTPFASLLASRTLAPEPEEEGVVIIYTSGTTGKPKGAVRRFARGQLEGFFAFVGEVPIQTSDRHLCVCPLYHSTALGFTAMTLMFGGTVVIAREFDPEEFLRTIERERITTTAIVPTLLHRIMALPDDVSWRYDTSSLRAIFCGGAQLPGPLGTKALDRFGPVLYNFYGATETGLVTVAKPDDLRAAPGTIGRAVPGNEIRLLDEQGREVPRGHVGELYARNAMLVEGYHRDAEATHASLREGFFSVGDLARLDEAGRYHIVGRRRDMVISGGVNVYPVEIEQVIEKHPAVAQVAVIGVPDEEWGERLRAFVVVRPGHDVSANELRLYCRDTLAGPKIPREWAFVDSLPSNPTGKVLKRELKHFAGEIVKV
jgi:fatty-acyl-CoA synthase